MTFLKSNTLSSKKIGCVITEEVRYYVELKLMNGSIYAASHISYIILDIDDFRAFGTLFHNTGGLY